LHLNQNHTTVRRELLAGLTTFMTMAYIVVVNPQILSQAGMPVAGVLFATCTSAALATLVMGLWAIYPTALAPGMSLNAYFTYSDPRFLDAHRNDADLQHCRRP
jgi:adenine/guanine/hypoxanthine permease